MNAKLAFVVALHVLAIYFVLSAITALPMGLMYYQGLTIHPLSGSNAVWATLVAFADPGLRLVSGIGLLIFAPSIGNRLYPTDTPPVGGEMDRVELWLQVGLRLLGVYALILAIHPISQLIAYFGAPEKELRQASVWDWVYGVSAGLYLALGLLLLLRGRQISAALTGALPEEGADEESAGPAAEGPTDQATKE